MYYDELHRHGGDAARLAELAGCRVDELLDFSANINPLGPPSWLRDEVNAALSSAARYPDARGSAMALAACEAMRVWPTEAVAGNGATELLFAAAALFKRPRAVLPAPAYVDYALACELAGIRDVVSLPLREEADFALDLDELDRLLDKPSLVFLGRPNNPTGMGFTADALRDLAQARPECRFVVDESFISFTPEEDLLCAKRPANVLAVMSLTKFYAIPGLRAGVAFAGQETAQALARRLPPWSVNVLAERVGERCFKDADYAERTRTEVALLRETLAEALASLPGIRVYPSEANFLLCRTTRVGMQAREVAEGLLKRRIALRLCDNFQGLDPTFFRVAVRTAEENESLIRALMEISGMRAKPRPRPVPALMVQGASSDAGKSVLAAGLCRVMLQDGLRPAPFKAQNMSLNSCVTADGREMGRAQVTQAQACRLAPDARMNPVLLKPGSDTGSQVIVMGRPVGNMRVNEYVEYKPKAFEEVKKAYASLAGEADVMVLEGAGSPAEVNLRSHDIVNMEMALHAGAKVLLVGDIDRGGVFAALTGTMELLSERERKLVGGLVLNKFRGDASLLDPAIRQVAYRTGTPFLGVVPYVHDLGLPEEDSVAFKAAIAREASREAATEGGSVDIALIDLPRISNFTDADPLALEPDVTLRVVRRVEDLGRPDALILPGSKNTMADLEHLRENGLARAILELPESCVVVGLCGGFQMLGQYIADPHEVEYGGEPADGLGLLAVQTVLGAEKTLTLAEAVHMPSGEQVRGYEIHHGLTDPLLSSAEVLFHTPDGRAAGYADEGGRVWGTYLHGVFDADGFRRRFVDDLRRRKGLAPLGRIQAAYDIEPALDRLADVVRQHIDMAAVYRLLGFT